MLVQDVKKRNVWVVFLGLRLVFIFSYAYSPSLTLLVGNIVKLAILIYSTSLWKSVKDTTLNEKLSDVGVGFSF